MTDKLNPCPFCGGEAEVVKLMPPILNNNFGIHCKKCRCSIATRKTKEEAIEAWNRRADNDNT